MADQRPGEVRLPVDPGGRDDARLAFIGHLRTPWTPGDAPRNLRAARDRSDAGARIELAPGYGAALEGLTVGQPILVLYWVDRGLRDLAVQVPNHGRRAGTFALRSPVRPNPIALGTVMITTLDGAAGVVGIDAIDAWDGTPVLDIKPWLSTVDMPPGWRPEP